MAVESEDINSSSPPIKKTKSSKPSKFKHTSIFPQYPFFAHDGIAVLA